ncbi:hypothetical protein HY085_01905 [Candidatus Gottesmanbacteria bacterium]|nr:hypothetical protein [Candidatus Gottesmanbacteria bacterium]
MLRHGFDFLLLALIIGLGLGGLVYFRFDTAAQIAVTILMSVFYVFWGIFHHHHDGNLTGKIILEYISIAALITFILIIFLLRV